jgi:Sec-independent protein secretion pathway component TatC
MKNKFFSREVNWRRVLLVSGMTAVVLCIIGCLLWYFFLYLPFARHLSENQRFLEEVRQLHKTNGPPVNASSTPQ